MNKDTIVTLGTPLPNAEVRNYIDPEDDGSMWVPLNTPGHDMFAWMVWRMLGDEGPNKQRESDVRRVINAVNACTGYTDLFLESLDTMGTTLQKKTEEMGLALYKAEQDQAMLVAALHTCARKFREYEGLYAAKPDPTKAAANAGMARIAELILDKVSKK
jgi:hypothetical protein